MTTDHAATIKTAPENRRPRAISTRSRRSRRKRHPVQERCFALTALFLALVLTFAPVAGTVNYSSKFYNGSTNYNVRHSSSWYNSRGAEASATPLAGNTICAFNVSGGRTIMCNSMASWSNRISYYRQTATNSCSLYDLGWGGSNIALVCYRGT